MATMTTMTMTAMTTKTGRKLSGIKTALAVGCLSGVSHLLWSLVVAIGVAQTLLDWVYVESTSQA